MEGRCKDCKSSVDGFNFINGTTIACSNDNALKGMSREAYSLWGTKPDFGCIHFEVKADV